MREEEKGGQKMYKSKTNKQMKKKQGHFFFALIFSPNPFRIHNMMFIIIILIVIRRTTAISG